MNKLKLKKIGLAVLMPMLFLSSVVACATGLLQLRDSNGKNLIKASATTQKQGG